MLLFPYDFDSSSAARCGRLHNIHVLVPLHLPFIQPTFIVFWEYIGRRSDIIVSAMTSAHLEYVSPEVVLSSELPTPWEVIYFLVLIDVLELSWLDNAGPEHVPG